MTGQYKDDDPRVPRSGDVLHVTTAASVQFAAPILFRVIRVRDWTTYDGWIWLDGYQLNHKGDAVERRSIFVQLVGLRRVGNAPDPRARNGRNERATTARRLPRPRTPSEPIAPTRRNR